VSPPIGSFNWTVAVAVRFADPFATVASRAPSANVVVGVVLMPVVVSDTPSVIDPGCTKKVLALVS
jgi:hypothetical protein